MGNWGRKREEMRKNLKGEFKVGNREAKKFWGIGNLGNDKGVSYEGMGKKKGSSIMTHDVCNEIIYFLIYYIFFWNLHLFSINIPFVLF